MPELRKDPVSSRWVIIASERMSRPSDFIVEPESYATGFCPFDEGNEDKTPPEIVAYRAPGTASDAPGWKVRVVAYKFPALVIEGDLNKRGDGIYDFMNGIGAHEVIIESPKHVVSLTEMDYPLIQDVFWIYKERLQDLKRDDRFTYGMIFKNVGVRAGATVPHAHSQIIVTPVVPRTVFYEMTCCEQFFDFRGRCLFCDMVQQELDAGLRVVVDGEHFVVFEPYAPRFPFETWIVPKSHASHYESIQDREARDLARVMKRALTRIETVLENPPYNYMIHTAPFNKGELEHYHWHIEIIPRLTRVAGFEWGTGFYMNPLAPERAAEFLREL